MSGSEPLLAADHAENDVVTDAPETPSESPRRALVSAIATLTLGILGSALLPIPYAFSRTGVLLGVVTSLVAGGCNIVTCLLLLRVAHITGHDSYEGVAEAIGGKSWKVLTQLSLVVLLLGTLCGDCALLHDVGIRTVHNLWLGPPPAWLMWGQGRVIEVLAVLLIVFPLCLLRRMRSLETVAYAGSVVVVAIVAIIMHNSWRQGFPAIHSKELPVWSMKWTPDLPEAFAVLGFSFYVHPMLMPLLHEMPRGDVGFKLISTATTIAVGGVAVVVYGLVGVFGAARYGLQTQGDLLVNDWLGGGRAEGCLDAVVLAYLAISMPPIQLSLRYTLTCLLVGEDAPHDRRRHVLLTSLIVGSALAVALVFPTGAEKIFAVTGATAVALVCYFLPVALHLMLRHNQKHSMQATSMASSSATLGIKQAVQIATEVVGPIIVCCVGVGVSFLALRPLLGQLFPRQH